MLLLFPEQLRIGRLTIGLRIYGVLYGGAAGTDKRQKLSVLRSDDNGCGGENSLCVAGVTHRLGDLDRER